MKMKIRMGGAKTFQKFYHQFFLTVMKEERMGTYPRKRRHHSVFFSEQASEMTRINVELKWYLNC